MRSLSIRPTVGVAAVVALALLAGLAGGVIDAPADPSPAAATQNGSADEDVPPSIVQPPNTTSYLWIPEERAQTDGYSQATVDVPGALAIDSDRLRVELAVEEFEREFNGSRTSTNRTRALESSIHRFDLIIDEYQARQQRALQTFNAANTEQWKLVRTLARADATARTISDSIDRIDAVADAPFDYSQDAGIQTRFANMESELVTLRGQVRRVFRNAILGGSQVGRQVYIETGDDDLIMATVIGNQYLRESYIGPSYNPNNEGGTTVEAASRFQDFYTWAFRPGIQNSVSFDRIGNTSIHRASVSHIQGNFDVYLDWNTNNVFREDQSKILRRPGPITTESVTNGTLRLRVNATHETGPMQLTLFDTARNTTVDGTIYIDGTRVGTTGADGSLWAVDTRGNTNIRAETDDGMVSMILFEVAIPG